MPSKTISLRPRAISSTKTMPFLHVVSDGQALFRAFLQREYSEENIEFWLAVEDYRKTRSSKQQAKARKIYNDFIATRAPKEVSRACLRREPVAHLPFL